MRDDWAGRLSRRELIAGALMAGGASVGAGSVAALEASPAAADTPPVTDGTLLSTALQMERLAVLAYRHVLTLPVIAGRPRRLLREFLHHNRSHARGLEQELKAFGVRLPARPTRLEQVDQALSQHNMSASASTASTFKDAIQALLDVEALCEGAYYTAVGSLNGTGPLVRCTQALGTDAQHSALLAQLLYPTQVTQYVPYWYVAGVS
jgi:hypothetical protein